MNNPRIRIRGTGFQPVKDMAKMAMPRNEFLTRRDVLKQGLLGTAGLAMGGSLIPIGVYRDGDGRVSVLL